MMTPQKGTTIATLIRDVLDELRAARVVSVSGGQLKRTPNGTHIIVQPQVHQRAGRATGLVFRGEYVEADRSQCQEGEMYVIMSGANRGTYICLNSAPQYHPWEGHDWIALPMGNSAEEWL